MARIPVNDSFLEGTRGRIVRRLRRGPVSVEELAEMVGLTNNAVRSHLAALERDGIACQAGVRRGPGAGKPAAMYAIHPDAEPIFSRAFQPVLEALLDELATDAPTGDADLMRRVGRRLAAGAGRAAGVDLAARVAAGAALLESLGAVTEVTAGGGALQIRGCGTCPLSPATARHPDLCRAIEALLSEYIGAPMQERCSRGERPRCSFETPSAA